MRRVRIFLPAGHETEGIAEQRGYRLWRSSYTMQVATSRLPSHRAHRAPRPRVRRVGLGVDAENETGALRLYERVGMTVARQSNNWVLDL
jgi:ribosomal protein S18 acetylase RimI-like enzyme